MRKAKEKAKRAEEREKVATAKVTKNILGERIKPLHHQLNELSLPRNSNSKLTSIRFAYVLEHTKKTC